MINLVLVKFINRESTSVGLESANEFIQEPLRRSPCSRLFVFI